MHRQRKQKPTNVQFHAERVKLVREKRMGTMAVYCTGGFEMLSVQSRVIKWKKNEHEKHRGQRLFFDSSCELLLTRKLRVLQQMGRSTDRWHFKDVLLSKKYFPQPILTHTHTQKTVRKMLIFSETMYRNFHARFFFISFEFDMHLFSASSE